MVAFFIPELPGPSPGLEESYLTMRRAVELDLGRLPSDRRIYELWTRRGRLDCFTAVGRPDPIHGGTVMAIFDMGPHRPFVVLRRGHVAPDSVCEVLGPNAYTVVEFDSSR